MKFTTGLPAVHFLEDDLVGLEKVILYDSTNTDLHYKLEKEDITYEFSEAEEIIQDPTLPDFIREFNILMQCEEGEVEIRADNPSEDNRIQLYINGDSRWVKRKKADINDYFHNKQDRIRTILDDRLEIIAALFIGILSYISLITDVGIIYGISDMSDVYRAAVVTLLLAIFSRGLFDIVYPYTIITLNPNKELYPFLGKVSSIIGLLAAVVTIVGIMG